VARGAFTGAAGAALGLIVLQVATTREGSGKVAGVLTAVDSLVKRAKDPAVPAIPDRSNGAPAPYVNPGVASPYIPEGFIGPVQPGSVPIPPAVRPSPSAGPYRPSVN
jgi:hypothetical protein